MFTGIIEQQGTIKSLQHKPNLLTLDVDARGLAAGVKLGDSIAVNGCCLTVTRKKGGVVSFDLMKETLAKTSLRDAKPGDGVNLELALQAGSRMGGHFVTGHVDEVGVIKAIDHEPNWVAFKVSISKENRRFLAPKGSITLDGISLTLGKVGALDFTVYLIPYTLQVTNLSAKRKGSPINIETDILAKYVQGVK